MRAPFFEWVNERQVTQGTALCLGLDPRPAWFTPADRAADNPWLAWGERLIKATADLVCCVKPNIAFYEAGGCQALEGLRATIALAHELGLPVILDAKRGDIGSTAEAYARACYEWLDADAVTLSPYLGHDAIAPFLRDERRGIFVLCHTSNPSAQELQEQPVQGRPLYEVVAERVASWGERVGLVVGATYPDVVERVRQVAPHTWLLLPGVGPQGGDPGRVAAAAQTRFVVPASRAIATAADPVTAARALRDALRAATPKPTTARPYEDVMLALHRIGAVQFGDFILASGRPSPIYIDLRLLVSHPGVLARVAGVYAELLRPLSFDRLAAIPYAGLPIGTAVALHLGVPLIYPRKETKSYGRQRAVEGHFEPGERVVVLEDLATTGGSALKGVAALRAAGLTVEDVVVLVDREAGAARNLAAEGLRLHAAFRLSDMVHVLRENGAISAEMAARVHVYLSEQGEHHA